MEECTKMKRIIQIDLSGYFSKYFSKTYYQPTITFMNIEYIYSRYYTNSFELRFKN